MAARDRYDVGISCPKCTNTGELHLSENDYPFMKNLGREVDGVEGQFLAEMQGDLDIKITCQLCGEIFIR